MKSQYKPTSSGGPIFDPDPIPVGMDGPIGPFGMLGPIGPLGMLGPIGGGMNWPDPN
jgi:hypothetical protein